MKDFHSFGSPIIISIYDLDEVIKNEENKISIADDSHSNSINSM